MLQLLILADDLTGAADCAARGRKAGLPATIFVNQPAPPLPDGVVAFTTDSRHLPPGAAAQRVRDAVVAFVGLPDVRWYKKIDSTLRGNIGAEVEAMLTVIGQQTRHPFAVVSPAFPAQRRGLRNGRLAMEGNAAQPTLYDRIMQQTGSLRLGLISLPVVRLSRTDLVNALRVARPLRDVVIVDAMDESDLEGIILAVEEAAPDALLCGSAGLMGAWARRLVMLHRDWVAPPASLPLLTSATLAVIGSGSPMSQRQVAAVSKAAATQTLLVEPTTNPQRFADAADSAAGTWLLHLPAPAALAGLDNADARSLAEHLADAALAVIQRVRPGRLILSGGDTALCVLTRLGMERLDVLAELQPGMPLTAGVDSVGRSWQIILKAGNHGEERTLMELLGSSKN
jgi:uncharacterized protein YgbK (DUF1537 family)